MNVDKIGGRKWKDVKGEQRYRAMAGEIDAFEVEVERRDGRRGEVGDSCY